VSGHAQMIDMRALEATLMRHRFERRAQVLIDNDSLQISSLKRGISKSELRDGDHCPFRE
jgi:hypothetical protein